MKPSKLPPAIGRKSRRAGGPKTVAGKKRSSRNAQRHGLAVPVTSLPDCDVAITRLARLICGDHAGERRLTHARAIAEAQLDLTRIREARMCDKPGDGASGAGAALSLHEPAFERYERRARSRRRAAILAFDVEAELED